MTSNLVLINILRSIKKVLQLLIKNEKLLRSHENKNYGSNLKMTQGNMI